MIKNAAEQILDFNGSGPSLMEISHRVKDSQPVVDEAAALIKELLQIPEGYAVIFLDDGAPLQFHMAPDNLFVGKAIYLNTDAWAREILREAKFFGEVVEVASSADKNYSHLPEGWSVPEDCDYFHITSSNTIYGTGIHKNLGVKMLPIVDMSSGIFSHPIDIAKYACICGEAQKNLAIAGAAFVIIREDMLGKTEREIPTILDYRTYIEKGSMSNTPSIIPIYSTLETLRWIRKNSGVEAMDKLTHKEADLLYVEVDKNRLFKGAVTEEDHSLVSTCFIMNDEYKDLGKPFLKFATEYDVVGIKGHHSVGGFRTSCYNAISVDGVKGSIICMEEFEDKY